MNLGKQEAAAGSSSHRHTCVQHTAKQCNPPSMVIPHPPQPIPKGEV